MKNIYEFNWGDETDWILAENKPQAKNFYSEHVETENFSNCKITRIPKKNWKDYNIIDIETDNEDIIETFADFVERESSPDIIATTAY